MATRRRAGSSAALTRQSAELALATPQVMAHRMMRMAMAGPELSDRDRKEFHLMGMEKLGAFASAWNAMAWASFSSGQTLAMQMWAACWSPWLGGKGSQRQARQLQNAWMGVLGKGLAPIHATATANARRLATTPLLAPPKARRPSRG